MSLARMIFITALLAGWAAFFGWLVAEFLVLRGGSGRAWEAVVVAAAVGAAIGAGVGGAAGLSEGNRKQAFVRAAFGLAGGCVGGLLGGLAGQLLYSAGLPRAVGWALMGLGIGATDGLMQRSLRKSRNGLIGGLLGGLVGGLLFDPISSALTAGTGMASRATGFVIMGLAIGALIGVVQVMLREAWVTVVDGFRTGRQLILTRAVTTMGNSELAHLPFLGSFGRPLEEEHAVIERRSDGRFVLVDNDTREGTRVNNEPVAGSVVLHDGDMIRLGSNYIRFNEQVKSRNDEEPRPAAARKPKPARDARKPEPEVLDLPDTFDDGPAPKAAAPGPPRTATPAPPPRPAAPPSARAPVATRPPAPPATGATTKPAISKPLSPDACPYCRNGKTHPGAPGERYCMIHDQTY